MTAWCVHGLDWHAFRCYRFRLCAQPKVQRRSRKESAFFQVLRLSRKSESKKINSKVEFRIGDGTESWTKLNFRVAIRSRSLKKFSWLKIDHDVESGEWVEISWTKESSRQFESKKLNLEVRLSSQSRKNYSELTLFSSFNFLINTLVVYISDAFYLLINIKIYTLN